MLKNVLDTDLSGKVAVITGAGGVLCSEIPAYSGAKAAVTNLTQWLAVHFSRQGIRGQRHCPRLLCRRAEPTAPV